MSAGISPLGFQSVANQIVFTLQANAAQEQKVSRQLADGLRITTAQDDPSGFAIATQLQTKVQSLDAAAGSLQTGLNASDVAAGALASVTALMQRLRALAVAGASDYLSDSDRASLQAEANALIAEVNTIGANTAFNGTLLFQPVSNITVPTIANYVHDASTGNGPDTFNLPSTPNANDLLVAIIGYGNRYQHSNDPPPTVSPPSGWTLASGADDNSRIGYAVYYKVANGADPTSYTFTNTPSDSNSGILLDISGEQLPPATPLGGILDTYETTESQTSPLIYASQNNDLPIAAFIIKNVSPFPPIGTGATWTDLGAQTGSTPYNVTDVQVGSLAAVGQPETASFVFHAGTQGGYAVTLIVAPQVSIVTPSIQGASDAQEGDVDSVPLPIISSKALALSTIDLTTTDNAVVAETNIDNALARVIAAQAALGAGAIRFQNDLANIQLTSLNTASAESTIRDANVAVLASEQTRLQLLQSVGTQLLAKNNTLGGLTAQLFR